jgi:hypothetical protein
VNRYELFLDVYTRMDTVMSLIVMVAGYFGAFTHLLDHLLTGRRAQAILMGLLYGLAIFIYLAGIIVLGLVNIGVLA